MAKGASRGKIANKIASKKNKGKMSKETLQKATKGTIGAKPTTGPKPKNGILQKGAVLKKTKQANKSEKQRINEQMAVIGNRIKEDGDEFVIPDADMISTDDEEEEHSMGFLDELVDQRQIKKLEKERKRRLENIGEDFEVTKRSFVAEEETKKAPLLPVVNPDTKEQVERFKVLEDKEEESEEESDVDETEDPNQKPLSAKDIQELQREMLATWPKRLANAANRAMSNPEEHAHSALGCFMQALSFDDEKKFMPIQLRQKAMLSAGAVLF